MGKKILLADDSITIQKVIELTFSDEDFEVVTVSNGRLAVERVLEIRPDIVLCDIIMPEKDGYEVCDFIKRHPQLSNVPVLLLTGAFEPFDQERAARVQCDGFLAKPFEPETLIAKVKDLLQKATARSSSITGSRMAVQIPIPAPGPLVPTPTIAASVAIQAPPVLMAPAFEAPAARELLPFPAPPIPAPATEEVRFIPDEPFDDLESAGFAPPLAAPEPEPTLPPLATEDEVYSVGDELETGPEDLVQMTPEESRSLATPVSDDSSSTVIFRPSAIPWTQATVEPTVELPLETRAQASLDSAQGQAPSLVEEATIFEEVLEEEVESLVGAEPSIELEPEPLPGLVSEHPVELSSPLTQSPEAPSSRLPAVVEATAQEAVVPALEHEMPVVAAVVALETSSIESFVGVAPPEEEAATQASSVAAEISVPNDMVAQIAQRVVAQISEKVVRQIAWEVIPDLAEGLIKREIERLKAELQQT